MRGVWSQNLTRTAGTVSSLGNRRRTRLEDLLGGARHLEPTNTRLGVCSDLKQKIGLDKRAQCRDEQRWR